MEECQGKNVNIYIKSYFHSKSITIPNVTIFFDIIKELSKDIFFKDASFAYNGKTIFAEMLKQPVPDDDVLTLVERSMYAPKNCFHKTVNIVKLFELGLENTINLYDVCILNHAKPGEWIGWGQGPIEVPKREDNTIRMLLFVVYNGQSFVYNMACFFNLIDTETDQLLIPHLNKTINAIKILDILTDGNFNILHIVDNDIVK